MFCPKILIHYDVEFAACATNRTISATWACRQQRLAMNSCMVEHATMAEQDAARAEWFASMDSRRIERAKQEMKKKGDLEFENLKS